MIKLFVLFGLFSLALSDCFMPCNQIGSSVGCAVNAICSNVADNNSPQILGCVCNETFDNSCESGTNGGSVLVCKIRQLNESNGCGNTFTNGCPPGLSCVVTTYGTKTCACNEVGATYNSDSESCLPPCPQNSVRGDGSKCKCVAPYIPSPNNTNYNNSDLVCVPATSCQEFDCPDNYNCEIPQPGATPVCVAGSSGNVCGRDFQCPDSYTCQDISNGPVCVCSDNRAGPGCAFKRCWALSSTGTLGCWSYVNNTASCISDPSGNAPYCACAAGYLPPDCEEKDSSCANVNCNVPNTICIDGKCHCTSGYVASGDSESDTFTCLPEISCTGASCVGNEKCVSNNSTTVCICPSDSFGAHDCNKPSCQNDTDCLNVGLVNSFCMKTTLPGINGYCSCKQGWAGITCNTQSSCNCDITNHVCDNEGNCVCAPGYTGNNCSASSQAICQTLSILVKPKSNGQPLTADQFQSIVASLISVDVSILNVTGPITVNSTVVLYIVNVCRNDNTDDSTASNNLYSTANSQNGPAQNNGIISATYGSITLSGKNSASILSSSILLMSIGFFLI